MANPIEPTFNSLEKMMTIAWDDHHRTRKQTWKSLKIEAFLAAGMLGFDFNVGEENAIITVIAGVLVMAAAFFGAQITIHHRASMIKNFNIIKQCEEKLGLMEIK